ncbi:MAG: alkaline phosphatase family protein, partial [Candidatus Nanohaloarchaea archaeon]
MTLLVFGMDGACKEYVEEAIERGLMPNLEKFRGEGAFGEMDSVVPPVTIPAWPSMFTGNYPDRFDTFHLFDMDERYRINGGGRPWKGSMVWDGIEGSFGVLGVPGTSGWPVKGYMVGGFPLTAENSYPEDLHEEAAEVEFVDAGAPNTREKRRKAEFENFEQEKKLYSSIDREADVKIEVYQLTDNAAHKSKSLDAVLEAYEAADKLLGEKLERYEDVLVVSDHGFTQVDRYFYINTWLEENGYLEEQESGGRSLKHAVQKLVAPLAGTFLRPALKTANDLLQKNTGTDFGFNADSPENIDYENTEAFCFQGSASHYGGIWVNDGRWDSPTVKDREKKVEEIREDLLQQEVIKNVWPREEVYEEPENMPDIVFETVPDTGVGVSLFPETTVGTNAFIHKFTGIVGALGPGFRPGEVEDAEIVDVAPTIARYLGQELDCDGEALDIFSE